MYKLYGREGAGSAAVEALLAELGLQFEVIEVARNPDKTTPVWFFDVNPRGEVPVLFHPDGSKMTESAAMMIYLADLQPKAQLAPALNETARASYLQAILFFATAMYGADLRLFHPDHFAHTLSARAEVKAKGAADLEVAFDQFAVIVGQGPFVLGEHMSAADIYAAMILSWSVDLDALFERQSNLKRLYYAVANRPAVKEVWIRHGMPV
jgi:glutathione S-transferase